MADESYTLPSGLMSTGDPVEGNPFEKGTARHKTWKSATRVAEERLARFNVEILGATPLDHKSFQSWLLMQCCRKFDIWALRNLSVVWSDAEVKTYAQWLFSYANSWLTMQSEHHDHWPTFVDTETVLIALRTRMAVRVEHWKAQALTLAREAEAKAAKADLNAPKATVVEPEVPSEPIEPAHTSKVNSPDVVKMILESAKSVEPAQLSDASSEIGYIRISQRAQIPYISIFYGLN